MPLPDELGQPGRPDRQAVLGIHGFIYVISSKEIQKGELFLYLAPIDSQFTDPNAPNQPYNAIAICSDASDPNIIKGKSGDIEFIALRSRCARLTHTIPLDEPGILN